MSTKMSFAMYKPHEGKRDELLEILKEHVPTLREYGMVSERSNYMAQASDGTIIEVFEWLSDEAKNAAHEHPAVARIWERMYGVCSFAHMRHLSESDMQFPDFELLK